jgi:hypothetical protein
MSVEMVPISRPRIVGSFVALSIALALTGCAGTAESASSSAPETLSAATSGTSADAETCVAFGDVLTIIANADAGLRDGRMEVQEQQGWYRLASRVLDRVPTTGQGAVSDALAALKEVVPAITPGAMGTSAFGSSEWNSGYRTLSDACADVDVEMTIQMFTGG